MARGWESKGIESQIEEMEARRERVPTPPDLVGLARQRERESLALARQRVMHNLQGCHSFRMEQQLRASLKHLDDKIEELK